MNQQATTNITHVHTVGVPVTDPERALQFYVDKLGFEKRMDAPSALASAGSRWHRRGR